MSVQAVENYLSKCSIGNYIYYEAEDGMGNGKIAEM
jgi:hypothetical protein